MGATLICFTVVIGTRECLILAVVLCRFFYFNQTLKSILKSVNGYKVKAPETTLPAGGKYDVARPDLPKKFIETKNCDELSDKHYLKMGLVFLSANDAIALANAMYGVDPGEPV